MIEKEIMQYLQTITALTSKLGGVGKIFAIQATAEAKTPWLVVEASGGTRERISAHKLEEVAQVRISVEAGKDQMATGRTAIEYAKSAVENLRGTLGTATDIYITCSAISCFAGLSGIYRYTFSCSCKFVEPWGKITPIK